MTDSLFASAFEPPAPNPEMIPSELCPGTAPLVLLPVRLETRFFPQPNGSRELRVRVYPDRIHIDTHHPELTTDERSAGTRYWEQDWAAGSDEMARAAAWRALASRYGAERAAWIARVLRPTNFAQRPSVPPLFPTLPPVGPNGESAWRHAPKARLLPDRWTAIVHANGAVAMQVTGGLIDPELAVGPDPDAAAPSEADDAAIGAGDMLGLDEDMLWMVDFEKAEDKGMGLRLMIPAAMMISNIDSLVVFGVRSSASPIDSAARLADLLDAHHYTDGLELLRFGAPTNNTDDRSAAYGTEDPEHSRSFANEVLGSTDGANAAKVGLALGLAPARVAPTLGRLAGAGGDHDDDQRRMNTALWQVGWGYYLTNMVGAQTGLTTQNIDWAREHFIRFVRAGGPLPTLCVGRQPYGILPITSLQRWQPGAEEPVGPEDSWLRDRLLRFRDLVWRPVLGNVPRIGLRGGQGDPDADLADLMQLDGISNGYLVRPVLGRHFVEHLYMLSSLPFNPISNLQATAAGSLLAALQLPTAPASRPHLARGFHAETASPVTAPLVQAGEVSPWRRLEASDPSLPNYIARLLATRSIDGLIALRPQPTATNRSTSLLEMLLRHAALREMATAGARILADKGRGALPTLLRDIELVDLVDAPASSTTIHDPLQSQHWRRQFLIEEPTPGITLGQHLESLPTFGGPTQSLGEFRESLAHLQDLDSESIQLLMQGTLDLSAHRLDAWITSYATKRLSRMQNDGPTGVYVGAYGWVENLAPATNMVELPNAAIPPGEQPPVYALPNDSGFIHAPSMTHAAAAAMLRNAHLGPRGSPSEDGPFAIDLSSRRVREASRLLDGVRQGQPLGALLGYRLERRLHDLRLDKYIAPLRKLAPLAVRERDANGLQADVVAANNVVDGLLLLEYRDTSELTQALDSATGTDEDRAKARGAIAVLADSVDGVSDALLAEVAYQAARGNAGRLSSTLAAVARGDAPPPELEVARTPRTGTAITHRVAVLFGGTATGSVGWTGETQRSAGEARLNAWVRAQLGDARQVRCTVERLDDVTGAVVETVAFALGDIFISPIDFVFCVQLAGEFKQATESPSTAEQLVLYHARRAEGFSADAVLRLNHARPTDLATGETTLFDLVEQARTIRRLLEGARGIRPEDVGPPENAGIGTIDLTELEARVLGYEDALRDAHARLLALVEDTAATTESLRSAMLALGMFGVEPFVPNVAVGDTPEIRTALARQAVAMLKVSAQRLGRDEALRNLAAASEQRVRCDQLLARSCAIYGDDFVSLPYFSLSAAASTELNGALAASTQQQDGDALAVHGWFARSSRVRDSVANLAACLRGAEVLGSGTRLDLRVAQLPLDADEPWVGLPLADDADLTPGKLSIVVQSLGTLDAATPMSGLFVDEWVEIVPSREETTALTFQFDPPNAFAPQNVLVAVPPVPGEGWTSERLRFVLMETLDLAKLRAVDPSLLGAAAQYLPALYVPFNAADAAVSTDFAPLTA
jgi:hypothetical protein